MALSIRTPVKLRPALVPATEQPNIPNQVNESYLPDALTLSSTPTRTQTKANNNCACETCTKIGPKPPPVQGNVWVPAWALQRS